jgi:16S rRNA (guanine527-N7)-methyltransferase
LGGDFLIYNQAFMDPARITELLEPFLGTTRLTESQLNRISTYIDILLRWNARINLTAIRSPEEIVTRHFGESLFAARHLFPGSISVSPVSSVLKDSAGAPPFSRTLRKGGDVANDQRPPLACPEPSEGTYDASLTDLGSGAGFPGLPIKIWSPEIHLTLVESNQKKATFLREAVRALALTNVNVAASRAEDLFAESKRGSPENAQPSTVTLRAVERFDRILPVAARLASPNGRLALLISQPQIPIAHELTPSVQWAYPIPIPMSATRNLLIGRTPIVNNRARHKDN